MKYIKYNLKFVNFYVLVYEILHPFLKIILKNLS